MATRAQIQGITPTGPVLPTAGGLQGVAGATGPTPQGLQNLAQFSRVLQQYALQKGQEQKDQRRATAQAQVQQAGSIVDDLVAGVVQGDDPTLSREQVARAMRRAQAAGLIKTADDPFFRTEMLVVLGERLAGGVHERVKARIQSGDTLDRELPNGDVKPGLSFDDIWNEEVAKTRSASVLDSTLASRTYAGELERVRPSLSDAAAQMASDHEVRILTETRQKQITDSAAAAAAGGVEEQDAQLERVQLKVDELYASNIPDAREKALRAVLDAAEYVSLTDPGRAREILTEIGERVTVLGRPMEQDPVIAVQLHEARLELTERERRDSVAAAQEVEARRARTRQGLEEQVGRSLEEMISAGTYTPLQARDVVLRQMRESLAGNEDRGFLMEPMTKYLDALVADRVSDPFVLDTVLSQIDLADTPDALTLAETLIEERTGDGLYGPSLAQAKQALRDRRDILAGAAIASDNTYNSNRAALAQFEAPDSLPEALRGELDAQLDDYRRRFVNEVMPLVEANNGRVPFKEVTDLGQKYQATMRELVASYNSRTTDVMATALADAEAGMRPRDLRAKYAGKIGEAQLARFADRSTEVRSQRFDLLTDPELRRVQSQLSSVLAVNLSDLTETAQVTAFDELNGRFESMLQSTLDAAPAGTDMADLRKRLRDAAKAFAAEERTKITDPVASAVRTAAEEGADPEELRQAEERALKVQADIQYAAQLTAPRSSFTPLAANHPTLQTYASPQFVQTVTKWHEARYSPGLFTFKQTEATARNRVAMTLAYRMDAKDPEIGKQAIAGFAPLGLTVDDVLTGSLTLPSKDEFSALTRFKDVPGWMDKHLGKSIKIDPQDIPAWSTSFFRSSEELRKFENHPDAAKFFKRLGITDDVMQDRWIRQQTLLLDRRTQN